MNFEEWWEKGKYESWFCIPKEKKVIQVAWEEGMKQGKLENKKPHHPLVIKPCPFCGENPSVVENDSYGNMQIFCFCEHEPLVEMPIGDMEKLKILWNRRVL